MREVCKWWRARSSQLLVLCSFAILLVWQNIELRRGERYFRQIVAEVRECFRQQEQMREIQFARLLRSIESRMTRIDAAIDEAHGKSGRATPPPAPVDPAARMSRGQF